LLTKLQRLPHFTKMAALALAALLAGCKPPAAPADPLGPAAFWREATPKVLGRKVQGMQELRVLVDLEAAIGREATLRAMMNRPEFVDHWTDVLLDDLRVQRISLAEVSQTNRNCFGAPRRSSAPTASLAQHVRSQAPANAAPGGDFNMVDLVRSSLVLDDLTPVVRAAPGPMLSQFPYDSTRLGKLYSSFALNRSGDCLGCHNSAFSTTDTPGWDRTWPVLFNMDEAIYGPANYQDPNQIAQRVYPMFRPAQFGGADKPWGMTSCPSLSAVAHGSAVDFVRTSSTDASLRKMLTQFRDGQTAFNADGADLSAQPNATYLTMDNGPEALYFLTLLSVTDNVWEEVMGSRLTIAHGLPRFEGQRNALYSLTQLARNSEGYSLKDLLVKILTSKYFARKAPQQSGLADPYHLPAIFDVWTVTDPRSTMTVPSEGKFNGLGDIVRRHSPGSLLRSVAGGVGWPGPERRFWTYSAAVSDTTYPSFQLVRATGQYLFVGDQGSKGIDFQNMLQWEADVGRCQKPAGVATDWVDRLITARNGFDASNPGDRLRVGEFAASMKAGLLGDPVIETDPTPALDGVTPPSEAAAIAALFGADIAARTSNVTNFPAKARRLCGVLLKSPRFMMTTIQPDRGVGSWGSTRLIEACNGAACNYRDICLSYVPSARMCSGTPLGYPRPSRRYWETLIPTGLSSRVPVSPGNATNARSIDFEATIDEATYKRADAVQTKMSLKPLEQFARTGKLARNKQVTIDQLPAHLQFRGKDYRSFEFDASAPRTAAEAQKQLQAYVSSDQYRSHVAARAAAVARSSRDPVNEQIAPIRPQPIEPIKRSIKQNGVEPAP